MTPAPVAYGVLFGFLAFGLVHMLLTERISQALRKARGLERSKDDYPFDLPTFPFCPQRGTVCWVADVLVRELTLGGLRVASGVAGTAVAVFESCPLAAFQLAFGASTAALLLLHRAFLSPAQRTAVWAALAHKSDLAPGPAPSRRFIGALLFVQMYLSVLAVGYMAWGEACAAGAAVRALLVHQAVAVPLMLLYAQVRVAVELRLTGAAAGIRLAHPKFVYYCSPLRLRDKPKGERSLEQQAKLQVLHHETRTPLRRIATPLSSPTEDDISIADLVRGVAISSDRLALD